MKMIFSESTINSDILLSYSDFVVAYVRHDTEYDYSTVIFSIHRKMFEKIILKIGDKYDKQTLHDYIHSNMILSWLDRKMLNNTEALTVLTGYMSDFVKCKDPYMLIRLFSGFWKTFNFLVDNDSLLKTISDHRH